MFQQNVAAFIKIDKMDYNALSLYIYIMYLSLLCSMQRGHLTAEKKSLAPNFFTYLELNTAMIQLVLC